MRRLFLQKFVADIKSSFAFYLSLAFFFFAGISAGAFTMLPYYEGGNLKIFLTGVINTISNNGINVLNSLAGALINNAIWLFLIFISGIGIFLLPCLYVTMLLEGFTFGIAASAFIGNFGFGGVIVVILCILPPSWLIAICHAKMSKIALQNALFRYRNRKTPAGAGMTREYLIRLSGMAIISALVMLLQAIAFPYLFQWLTKVILPLS